MGGAHPLLAFFSLIPGISCLLYARAESKANMNNFFMAFVKSIVMTPFLGWMWMTYSVRTVLREIQEVPGSPASDCVAYAFCWCMQPFQLYMNAAFCRTSGFPRILVLMEEFCKSVIGLTRMKRNFI